MIRHLWLVVVVAVTGCGAPPKVNLASNASRATGIENAILFTGTDEPADDHLTSAQAVRLALHHDPRIGAVIARVRASEADDQQARLLPNPILNIDVRFPEGGGSSIFEATLTGDLIALLEKPGRIKAADQRLRGAAADAITTVLDVIAQVQEDYAAAQSIDAEIEILKHRQQIGEQMRGAANARLNAGEGTRLDVLTIDSQQLQLELDLAGKDLERADQRLTLARLIGDARGKTDWKLDAWEGYSAIHASESAWIDSALVNRPEIQSHAWELAALGEEVNLSSLAFLEGGEIGAHGEHDQSWAVGPTITIPLPIFDFGQAAQAKAKAMKIAARHELEQQRLEVIEDVRRAYARYGASNASLEMAQEKLMPLQQQQRDLAEAAYRSGDTDLTTFLLAENGLQETRSKLVELQQQLTVAMIRLQRAAGGAGVVAEIEMNTPTTQSVDGQTGTTP